MNNCIKKTTKTSILILVLVLCFLPMLPGLSGLLLAAFAINPRLNQFHGSLSGFEQLAQFPGISQSILMTLNVSIISTFLSVLISFVILRRWYQSKHWQKIENAIAPILALPHVAFAIGFAFLFTPSGFISRLSTELFEFALFTDVQIIKHQLGLIIGLTLKEVPFILFMSIALLKQLNIKQSLQCAQSLGFSQQQAWLKVIFPQWLPKMRFSIIAIMAYSLSVVDVSLIIGPSIPSTLPVMIWSWLNESNLDTHLMAASGALVLALLCVLLVYTVIFVEWLIVKKCTSWQFSGRKTLTGCKGISLFTRLSKASLAGLGSLGLISVLLASSLSLIMIIVWSFSKRWPYPHILPSNWSLQFWQSELPYLFDTFVTSIGLAMLSATIALLLVLVLLEVNNRNNISHKVRLVIPMILIVTPIIAPQLSLLLGIQLAAIYIGAEHFYLWVLWSHVFFVFPYIYLSLDGPWRSFDQGFNKVGLSLGKSAWTVWWTIKIPLLLPAIVISMAVGISVSLAQFLPTLMLGAGRIATITTEAVALSSGQDRRVMAIYALLQTITPLFFFAVALFIAKKTGPLESRTPFSFKKQLKQHKHKRTKHEARSI
ncbi:ABC transporter permease [Psychromonas sp. Urea-02u-13]|uniref:ABC transporter permease n=1 Tax=Psychromonas sp. Urea-02u-13 TaxID=2058326 RepID=UPI0018E3812A|nr:thiamine ABC transporter permease [Psychromonas sp. Urea-02u-13]